MSPETNTEKAKIAVIITEVTDLERLKALLTQLTEQDYPQGKLEIVVVHPEHFAGGYGLTREFGGRLPGLKLAANYSGTDGSAHNLGLAQSSAEQLLFLDDHCFLPRVDYLKQIESSFESSAIDSLCRPTLSDPPGVNLFHRASSTALFSFLGPHSLNEKKIPAEGEVSADRLAGIFRRSSLGSIGNFDETFRGFALKEMSRRFHSAGTKRWSNPALQIQRYPVASLGQLWRWMLNFGIGRYQFTKKHGKFSLMQLALPWALVFMGLFTTVAVLSGFVDTEPFQVWFNLYAGIILLVSLLMSAKEKQLAFLFSLPVIFPVIHVALGFGFWKGWLYNRRLKRGSKISTDQSAPPAPEQSAPAAPEPPAPPS